MKHIKPYQIFESQVTEHPGFPTTEEEIHNICKKYKIDNYTINDDLSIDVSGNLDIQYCNLEYLPLKFNYVGGDFNCSKNKLLTLVGSPKIVGEHFICVGNNLTTLEGSPEEVGMYFYCNNNKLTTIKGAPHIINGVFYCHNNNLKSLEPLPEKTTGFQFYKNPIDPIIKLFNYRNNINELIYEFNEYSIIRGDKIYWGRLVSFLTEFDFEITLLNIDKLEKHYEII